VRKGLGGCEGSSRIGGLLKLGILDVEKRGIGFWGGRRWFGGSQWRKGLALICKGLNSC